jgi:hypothetical protein
MTNKTHSEQKESAYPPCVDGSRLARAFFMMAGLVDGAHMFGLCVRCT